MTKYPLTWPAGWRRTPAHRRVPGRFTHYKQELNLQTAVTRLMHALELLGVGQNDVVLSTNLKLRLDGFPRSDQPMPVDPGAAVYWTRVGNPTAKCMAIDQYTRVEQNIAGLAATLDAMRAIERHGNAMMLDRAFEGFIALPAGQKPWRQVFGFADDQEVSRIEVEGAYRTAAMESHPDRPGGSHDAFLAVQAAYEAAARELGFKP